MFCPLNNRLCHCLEVCSRIQKSEWLLNERTKNKFNEWIYLFDGVDIKTSILASWIYKKYHQNYTLYVQCSTTHICNGNVLYTIHMIFLYNSRMHEQWICICNNGGAWYIEVSPRNREDWCSWNLNPHAKWRVEGWKPRSHSLFISLLWACMVGNIGTMFYLLFQWQCIVRICSNHQ